MIMVTQTSVNWLIGQLTQLSAISLLSEVVKPIWILKNDTQLVHSVGAL